MLTIQTLVGFTEKGKGKHTGSGEAGDSALGANLTSVEDYDYYYDEDMDESANTHEAHNDPVDPGSDDGEGAREYDDGEENDTFSSCFTVDDAYNFLRLPNSMQLLFSLTHGTMTSTQKLARSWCKQMYELTFLSERREVRAQVRASFLFAHHVC